jgi:hypothetical protein
MLNTLCRLAKPSAARFVNQSDPTPLPAEVSTAPILVTLEASRFDMTLSLGPLPERSTMGAAAAVAAIKAVVVMNFIVA